LARHLRLHGSAVFILMFLANWRYCRLSEMPYRFTGIFFMLNGTRAQMNRAMLDFESSDSRGL
jgi:hypothetical protein